MSHLVVIPARYESSRLPGKPLVSLLGVPMIIRTYRQCLQSTLAENILIATDDERIQQCCESAGIRVMMTSKDCLTGTDRVAEVARAIDANVYINVQGDEPVFNPRDLNALIRASDEYPSDVINGYCQIHSEEMFRSTSTPKVAIRPDGRLLYMSRSAIPGNKDNSFVSAWRQVCAYSFPRKALEAFSSVKEKTPLEAAEDIEILRFLELGWDVRMIPMSDGSVAVDRPEDVAKAEEAIRALCVGAT